MKGLHGAFSYVASQISTELSKGYLFSNPPPEEGLTAFAGNHLQSIFPSKIVFERRRDEKISGADFDMHIVHQERRLSLRIQAKRQYVVRIVPPRNKRIFGLSGSYKKLDLNQLSSLTRACPNDMTPMALFYTGTPFQFHWTDRPVAELAGCVLSAPDKIVPHLQKVYGDRRVSTHLPSGFPWQRLVENETLEAAHCVLSEHSDGTAKHVAPVQPLSSALKAILRERPFPRTIVGLRTTDRHPRISRQLPDVSARIGPQPPSAAQQYLLDRPDIGAVLIINLDDQYRHY